MAWPSAAIRAMQNDVVDGTILSLSEAVRVQADGYKIVIAGALGISSGADAVMSLKVNSMAELRGKRVGIEPRSCANYVLALGLHKVGLTLADVKLVEMNLPETVDALLSGEVDAVATAEPFRTLIEQSKGHCLFDSSELGSDIVRVLVTSEKSFEERHTQWARVAVERDASLPEQQPSLLEALARREKLTPESLMATRRHQQPLKLSGPDRMTEEQLSELLKKTAAAMVETGQIDPIDDLPKIHLIDQREAIR
ncbi:MAG: ABC transporter substrate-binding protein [Verrucomicrobiaceae bacterium]|nr:ABC transporter substrate-binding protein [Verrucomicrobiaceae bacterium]